jgi:hypothetical protein
MNTDSIEVTRFSDIDSGPVVQLLSRYGLSIRVVPAGRPIPGSFWGDEEAGLVGNELIVRPDTPLHSILHETCHYICMDEARRQNLNTNAGGDYDEENAVCYLQILLSAEIPGFGQEKMIRDMDAWGYSFRLGSAQAWFKQDATDARKWLLSKGLITANGRPAQSTRSER